MTEKGWRCLMRLVDEAFGAYLSGMVEVRERVVIDLKHKLSDGKLLDRLALEESSPRGRPASTVRRPRARRRRPRS